MLLNAETVYYTETPPFVFRGGLKVPQFSLKNPEKMFLNKSGTI